MMLCKAITKKGKHCRLHALQGDTLCNIHRNGPTMLGKNSPNLSAFPTKTKTGRYSLFKLSGRKKSALIRDLLRGDRDLDLGYETAVARYVSATIMLYLRACEDQPFEDRKEPMELLLNAVLTTARIVDINAGVQQAANPLAQAFNEALAAISEFDASHAKEPK